jgi:DNA polymerase III alpha subunit
VDWWTDQFLDIYRDNFYIELHTYPGRGARVPQHSLVQMAQTKGIPVVYATDAHFAPQGAVLRH